MRVVVSTETSCSNKAPVLVVVAANLEELAQKLEGGVITTSKASCEDATGRVGDAVTTPAGAKDEPIAFAVMTRKDGQPAERCGASNLPVADRNQCIVAKRALRFVPHELIEVDVPLQLTCSGVLCSPLETCSKGICVSASCRGTDCNPQGTGGGPSDAGSDAPIYTGCAGMAACTRYVFITSGRFQSLFMGTSGADQACQAAADASTGPARGRRFRAWISDFSSSANKRLTHGTAPYQLVDNTMLAKDWAAFTSGTLAHAIDVDENGGPAPMSFVWTDTTVTGDLASVGSGCDNWTSTGAPGSVFGNSSVTDAKWSDSMGGVTSCSQSKGLPLYCVED
jgi:hypothetical protein